MHNKIRKTIACAVSLGLVMSSLGVTVYSDGEEAAAEEPAAEDAAEVVVDEDFVPMTDDEALGSMKLLCENDKLALYVSTEKKSSAVCLKNKATGRYWWSNPIDAPNMKLKKAQKNELSAGMSLTYAEPSSRRTTTQNSQAKSDFTVTENANGIDIVYNFTECGITVPVSITLEDDHLKLYCNLQNIVEANPSTVDGMLTSALSFMTSFGAAGPENEGYFVIPDGEGALINFNNDKVGYRAYSAKVYGSDVTPVTPQKGYTTRNVMLNMFGIVKDGDGLLVVADKGDAAASINAYVAGQNKTLFNGCYFSFETRTSDEYLMGGESNPLKVFEKRGILVPEIELRYYPVSTDDGSAVDYTDIAAKYREYLVNSCGVPVSPKINDNSLYVNLYGGTLKKESILGIPVTVKKKVTGFDDALKIVSGLSDRGVDGMVLGYKDWTSADIGEKISTSASPAAVLGGGGKFKKLTNYVNSHNIAFYPDTNNFTFSSSLSFPTITNTAIRVSNSYSRQIVYDLAHGVENKFYKSLSLFTPASYDKAFNKAIKNYNKKKLSGMSMGSLANKIYGDYGKKAVSREMAKGYVENIYANAKNTVGSVMADNGSKYVYPYVDCLANMPLSSSKFDLFDSEIPFVQMVLHGLIPYGTTPVNAEADTADFVLYAIASGSNLGFDFIAEEADELKDTKYDSFYYAYYEGWLDDAAGCYRLQKDILSDISDQTIVEYNISADGNEIETVYDDLTKTVVNFEDDTVKLNGTTYKLSDYLSQGVIGE